MSSFFWKVISDLRKKRGYYVNKIAVVTGGAPGYAAPVKRFQGGDLSC